MSKKLMLILISVMVVAALLTAGCGGSKTDTAENKSTAEQKEKPVRVAIFTLIRANTWEQAYADGAESKLKELNAEMQVFSCEFNTQEQINQIKDAITAGNFDALIIHPQDSNAVVPVVKEALAKGIKVIAGDAPIGPDVRSLKPYPEGVSSVVGRTGWSTGNWLGKYVVKASEGMDTCEVVYLIGSQGLTIDQDRYEGLKEQIKDHPNIKVVAFQEAGYDRNKAREVMQNVLQAHPGVDVVVSSGDQMTLGAEDAAKELGIKNIKYIGNGCSQQGYDALKEGRWYASYADIPYTEGQLLMEYAVKAVRGEEVPSSFNLEDMRPPLPAEGPVITPDNVDKFKSQWS